jgi:hypothetical protein
MRPVLLGEPPPDDVMDDLQYVIDLGLLARSSVGYEPSNPLYREVLARSLSAMTQHALPDPWWPWKREDGGLDFPALLDAFFGWWRGQGDLLVDRVDAGWREAAAHIAFMGFLQRVVNGGGQVTREYGSGRGRLDLLVEYGSERFAVEIKRVPPEKVSFEAVRQAGIDQLSGYLAQLGLTEGWLVIFDQRVGRTWDERLWREDVLCGERRLHLRGG